MIPGSNILNMAFSLIAKQKVIYKQYLSRSLNSVGQEVTTYIEPGTSMYGSLQPVPRNLEYTQDLDLQKSYYTFYTSNNVLDVQRNVSGDQIVFNGKLLQVESANDWFAMDGWVGVLCSYQGDV